MCCGGLNRGCDGAQPSKEGAALSAPINLRKYSLGAVGFGEGSPVFQGLETNPSKEAGFGAEGGGGVENNPVEILSRQFFFGFGLAVMRLERKADGDLIVPLIRAKGGGDIGR